MAATVTNIHVPRSVAGKPPHSVPEVEDDILAMSMTLAPRYKHALEIFVELIEAKHFFRDTAKRAWSICVEMTEAGQRPTIPLVKSAFRDRYGLADNESWLDGLTPGRTDAAPEELARRLIDSWRQREIGWALVQASGQCYGEVESVDEFIASLHGLLERFETKDGDSHDVSLADGIRTVFSEIQERGTGDVSTGRSTGLRDLDKLLGGLVDGDLIVLAGRPSMGKTSLGMQMAEAVATSDPKLGVSVFSMEMLNAQIITRAVCTAARVSMTDLRSNRVTPDGWARLTQAAVNLSHLKMRLCDQKRLTPGVLRAKARKHARWFAGQGARLALVVIDYLGMMNMAGLAGFGARHDQHVGEAIKILKAMAQELSVPVVLCAQLNRKSGSDRPQLDNLRDSGEIEQDADGVIFVHRPEHYLRDQTPRELEGIAELIVAKQRNGATGVIRAKWFGESTCFADLDPRDDRYVEECV